MEQTGRPMTLWRGNCYAHVEFRRDSLLRLRAAISRRENRRASGKPARSARPRRRVCSTEKMITYCKIDPAKQFVIVTESGIIHRMQKECPDKEFICAPVLDVMRAADGSMPLQRVQIHEDEYA